MSFNDIRIGALYPLTGDNAFIGQSIRQALDLYVDLVNNKDQCDFPSELILPYLHGKKIKLIWADTQGDPIVATTQARKLVEREGVVSIIGSFQSTVSSAVALQTEILKIPYLSPDTDAISLSQRGLKWLFRTGPTNFTYTKGYFDMMAERGFSKSTVSSLVENSLLGQDEVRAVIDFSRSYGHDITSMELYDPNLPITREKLHRIKCSNPDFLFTAQYSEAVIQTIRLLMQINYYPKAIFEQTGVYTYMKVLKTLGKAADYAFSTVIWTVGLTKILPLARIVNSMYQTRYGVNLNTVNTSSFIGLYVLIDAISRAEYLNPNDIRKALIQTDISGNRLIVPWKGIRFDSNGQNIYAESMLVQILNNTPKIVWPEEYAEADAILPAPQWCRR